MSVSPREPAENDDPGSEPPSSRTKLLVALGLAGPATWAWGVDVGATVFAAVISLWDSEQ